MEMVRNHIADTDNVDERRYDRIGLANFIKGQREERGIPQHRVADSLSMSRMSYISVESPDTKTGRSLHKKPGMQDLHLIGAALDLSAEDTLELFRLAGYIYTKEDVLADASKIRGKEVNPLGSLEDYVGNLIGNFKADHPDADFMKIYTMLSQEADRPDLNPKHRELIEKALSQMEKVM